MFTGLGALSLCGCPIWPPTLQPWLQALTHYAATLMRGRHSNSWLAPVAGFGGVGGPSTILVGGPVGALLRLSWQGPASGSCGLVGPSPTLAKCTVGAVPRYSWPGPAAGFGEVGGPSPILAEGPVGAVPRLSRLGPGAGFGGVVPRQSRWRALWVRFPTNPGRGLLLALMGVDVPRQSGRGSCGAGNSVSIPALPCFWLLQGGWSLAFSGRQPCGCCFPPFLAWAC